MENIMLKRFIDGCDGQDMVEYGLVTAALVLVAVSLLPNFQTVISNVWTQISANLSGGG